MSSAEKELTPLMRQYFAIKGNFNDALLFFQVGDFYELFFEDAKIASSFLGIALTKRGTCKGEPVPLCGVPIHALDHYLTKLIKGGFKVALCDQLEEPKPGTVVKRGVTQVLTPGTLTDSKLLDDKSPSYLFSFFPLEDRWGLLFGELLTARLFGTVLPANAERVLESELTRFVPDEIVLPAQAATFKSFFTQRGFCTTPVAYDYHDEKEQKSMDLWLQQQFKPELIRQLSLADYRSLRSALYNFYAYVRRNQEAALNQFHGLSLYDPEDFLVLDASTQRNIELVRNCHDGSRHNSLFAVVDRAKTAMGSRTIKKWLLAPLVDRSVIEQRHAAVQALVQDPAFLQQLSISLEQCGDLERLIGRIALGRALVHDYRALGCMLASIPVIRQLLSEHDRAALLMMSAFQLEDFNELAQLLSAAINDDATQDCIIKPGFDKQLDHLCDLVGHAQEKLLALELKEQEATGISTLKIRYNQVFGYSFEITKSHLAAIPSYFVRQQTLAGKERFTTTELRQLEHDISRARTDIEVVERAVFAQIKDRVATFIHSLRRAAYALSRVDALVGFAMVAADEGYVRPQFHDGHEIVIQGGRHPVVASALGHQFIANDLYLTEQQPFWIITGPNMGGKSTFLRQVALISILAQAGSFVPAAAVRLPILDRIFTRIGAGDNLSAGKSTFLVEMEETALICTQATERSLVILDEVGRGTSTYDGLALAQAVVEYIAHKVKACCLFATHYHELTLLKDQIPGIASYYMVSTKTENGILFLYKIKEGVADGSFGIEVAKLAGLPGSIVQRAQEILARLTISEQVAVGKKPADPEITRAQKLVTPNEVEQLQRQLAIYQKKIALLENIDQEELSPKKAFDLIWQLKEFYK